MIQAKLKLEIIIGYLIWAFFLVLIVYIVRDGWRKQNVMERQESHWQGERLKTNQAFLCLLDLASTGELIAGWTQEDYAAYRKKWEATVTLLQNLKVGQEDILQRECIDSVCNLLAEKEKQMAALLQLLENIPDAGEIVHRKIPAAVSQSKEQAIRQEETPATGTGGKKKKNLWNLFRKQEKKSAYAVQREKAREESALAGTTDTKTTAVKYCSLDTCPEPPEKQTLFCHRLRSRFRRACRLRVLWSPKGSLYRCGQRQGRIVSCSRRRDPVSG